MPLRLKQFRLERGLTQDRVAGDLGLSIGQVSKLERGDSALSVDRLAEFASLYGCEPADLISEAPLAGRIAVVGALETDLWHEPTAPVEAHAIALPALGPLGRHPRRAWRVDDHAMSLVYPKGAILIGPDQGWLNSKDFLDAIDRRLRTAMG